MATEAELTSRMGRAKVSSIADLIDSVGAR
jgi:hypothetical protein